MRLSMSGVSRRLFSIGFVSSLLVLAGCTVSNFSVSTPSPVATGPAEPVTGEVLGNGSVRVALLVPLSANGNAAQIAQNIRNASALALQEFQNADIQVMVKDTGGTAEGARAAAEEAIRQGAELILGPLFSETVAAASAVTRPAGVPMVAFSTDVGVAAPGVYLLSFLPRTDVQRIIPYAASQGYTSVVALLPATAYGTVVEAALAEVMASSGARLVAVERYALDRTAMQASAETVAGYLASGQADAVFVPDGGDATPFMVQIMAAAGVDFDEVKLLGSGQWNDDRIKQEATMVGGWYPGPEVAGFEAFAGRYAAQYGARPFPTASLGYDATILAAGLAANFGPSRYSTATLTDPNGFRGIDGAFRFLSNGVNQRSLAVYEVTGSGARVLDPAASGFNQIGGVAGGGGALGGIFNF